MKKTALFLVLFAILMANCAGTEGTSDDNNSNPIITTDGDTDVTTEGDVDSEIGITETDDAVETDVVEVKSGKTHPGKYGVTWVEISGGTFMMGDDESERGYAAPRHLEIVAPFMMGQTVVTKQQYVDFLNERGNNICNGFVCAVLEGIDNPNHIIEGEEISVEVGYENKPMLQMTWYGAKAFCEAVDGRLQEEAEWEYGARAGIVTKFFCGDEEYEALECAKGYYCESQDRDTPCDVYDEKPNAFGLYNTIRSVFEWTNSLFTEGYGGVEYGEYVSRGTPWDNSYLFLYSTRWGTDPDEASSWAGFRCAKDF